MKRLTQAWRRDRLRVLGVGSAVVAFLLWAWPGCVGRYSIIGLPDGCITEGWFSSDRLPAIAAFLALAFILPSRPYARVLKRLKQVWKADRLGVLGVGSAIVALMFWASPVQVHCSGVDGSGLMNEFRDGPCVGLVWMDYNTPLIPGNALFTGERLPIAAAFLALAFVLLLLRRR